MFFIQTVHKKGKVDGGFLHYKHKTDETLMTVKIVSEKNVWRIAIKNSTTVRISLSLENETFFFSKIPYNIIFSFTSSKSG